MRIAIVGAGASGLSATHSLLQQQHQVDLYEAQPTVGGLAGGFKLPHWQFSAESYYHHWFSQDRHLLRLIHELRWQDDLIIRSPRTAIWHQDQFYPLDSPSSLLAFPGFSLANLFRFGLVTSYLKYLAPLSSVQSTPAATWLTQFYGSSLYSSIWQPLLEGKFGSHASQVTMAWMWARLKARTSRLITFAGGFQAFFDRFAAHLQARGARLYTNTPIKQLSQTKNSVTLHTSSGTKSYAACLVTTSPSTFLELTPQLPQTYLTYWANQPSLGAITVLFSLKHPLSPQGYYWYNLPKSAGFPFLALVEHTQFLSPENFGGDHLVYCGDYLSSSHSHFSLSQKDLVTLYSQAFTRINPSWQQSWLNQAWVFKTAYAQPVPSTTYHQHLPTITTPLSRVFFVTLHHIYPWDRGTNYALKWGQTAANLIHSQVNYL